MRPLRIFTVLSVLALAVAPASTSAGEHASPTVTTTEGDGCACNSARAPWPSMLALPWLLLFLRLRITREAGQVPGSRPDHAPPGGGGDAAHGNTLLYDPTLSEPPRCTMLRTLRP